MVGKICSGSVDSGGVGVGGGGMIRYSEAKVRRRPVVSEISE